MVAKSAGFSLIELTITMAIMALLAGAAAPFTLSWVRAAKVSEAKSKLLQGYVLAKALAQRNPTGANAPAAAAGLRLENQTLFVCAGDPANPNDCAATGVNMKWQTPLPPSTTIKIGTQGSQTLALDNTGLPLCMPLSESSYKIENGDQNETGDLL